MINHVFERHSFDHLCVDVPLEFLAPWDQTLSLFRSFLDLFLHHLCLFIETALIRWLCVFMLWLSNQLIGNFGNRGQLLISEGNDLACPHTIKYHTEASIPGEKVWEDEFLARFEHESYRGLEDHKFWLFFDRFYSWIRQMNFAAKAYESFTVEGRVEICWLVCHIHHALKLKTWTIHNTWKVVDHHLIVVEFVSELSADESTPWRVILSLVIQVVGVRCLWFLNETIAQLQVILSRW